MKIRFKTNEIKLILLLTFMLLGIKYKDSFYLPKKKIIKDLINQNSALNNEISSIKVSNPDLAEKEIINSNLRKILNDFDSEFKKTTTQIPNQGQLDRFLYHLTTTDFAHDIKFTSIKPSQKTDKNDLSSSKKQELFGYEKKEFIIELEASYSSIYNYINYLENLSQFATISSLKIFQNIDKKSNKIEAKISFAIFISNFTQDKTTEFKLLSKSEYEKIASPFVSFHEEDNSLKINIPESENPNISISGIIMANNEYRVIIDEMIYKEGQSINNMTIKKIYNDKIIVESSGKTYEIPIQ